jgi:hypothetical protein
VDHVYFTIVARYTLSGFGNRRADPAAGRTNTGCAGAGRSVAGPFAFTIFTASGLLPDFAHGASVRVVPPLPTTRTVGRGTPPFASRASFGR